jgi:hypothetical protein
MCWASLAVAGVSAAVGAKSSNKKADADAKRAKAEAAAQAEANQISIERNRKTAVDEQENFAKRALQDAQEQELESALSISQIELEIAADRVRAQGEMNDRLREYLRVQSSNRAAISASGLYSNKSYVEGIAKENRKTANRDRARTLAQHQVAKGRGDFEISVNAYRSGSMWGNYATTIDETNANINEINSASSEDQLTNMTNAKRSKQNADAQARAAKKSAWIGAGLEFAGTAVSLSNARAKMA